MDIDCHTFFGSTMNYFNVQVVETVGSLIEKNDYLTYGGLSEKLHDDLSAIDLCLAVLEKGQRIVANPVSIFSLEPSSQKITHEDIYEAYTELKHKGNFNQIFYSKQLSYGHLPPTLAMTKTDAIDMSLDAILARHYQNNSHYLG